MLHIFVFSVLLVRVGASHFCIFCVVDEVGASHLCIFCVVFFVLFVFVLCLVSNVPCVLDYPFLTAHLDFSNFYQHVLLKWLYKAKQVSGHVFVYFDYRILTLSTIFLFEF